MKNMRFLCVVVSLLMVASLCSCANGGRSPEECGLEVISLMDDMLRNEECAKLYDVNENYGNVLAALQAGDYSKPSAVYEISVPVEKLLAEEVDADKLSDELYDYFCSNAYISIASQINNQGGMDAFASALVSIVYTVQKCFVSSSVDDRMIYLYVFENGYPITVAFVPGEDGTVRAAGHFIIHETFATDDAQAVEQSFAAAGFTGVQVTEK